MTGLRILLVADMEPRRDSGAAGTEIELAEELARQGHEVLCRWHDALPHRIGHWNLYHLLEQPRAMRGLIERERERTAFDVFQVNQPAGWLAARQHRRNGCGGLFVHRSHGFEPRIGAVLTIWSRVYPEDRRPLHRRLASRLLSVLLARNYRGIVRYAEAHVVSCRECADDLARRGVLREQIHVSPQVPTADFLDSPAPEMTPKRLHRILYVGQHRFFKAPMIVAEVFNALLSRNSELQATWVCEPEAVEEVANRLAPDARPRVEILPWQPRSTLLQIYDRHGLFLLPSFTEGFGKVFLEAMSRGACVVSAEQGGARDVITPGVDGLLAPVGDVRGLVAASEVLLADLEVARGIGSEARRTAEAFTWLRIARDLAAFYRERLEAKGVLE
ncbi:MAG TPA: glycosyltransferase family 4 protein [Planctomycetota bacterium]|nr:glycosyltransferase family 4 protein [Planctomycetota bacterium]